MEAEWIDEHRYALTRSFADTLTRLATLCEQDTPEQALDALERVREMEPEVEENYLRIAVLQSRLGHGEEAKRTVALLRQTLHGLGLAPTSHAEQKLSRITDSLGI